MKTPASLLQRLRQPADQDAWSRLVQLYLPLICYWARRAGLQDADVQDLSQEVFAVLYRTLPSFSYDRHRSFRSWLWTVTRNKCRELHRRRAAPVPAGRGGALDGLADDETDRSWEEEHNRYVATRALQLMRTDFEPRTWQACWQTVVEDQPADAVAQRLGMTVAAVYAAKSRVLRQLRRELEGLL
jgi:RNA polymerase sigma-70 factor (ECF subfamily)